SAEQFCGVTCGPGSNKERCGQSNTLTGRAPHSQAERPVALQDGAVLAVDAHPRQRQTVAERARLQGFEVQLSQPAGTIEDSREHFGPLRNRRPTCAIGCARALRMQGDPARWLAVEDDRRPETNLQSLTRGKQWIRPPGGVRRGCLGWYARISHPRRK